VRANRLPAASGLRWIAGGFLIFRAAPLRLLALDFVFLMTLGIVVGLPLAGFALVWVLLPAFVVGPHALARAAARGAAPDFAALVSGLRRDLAAQLRLGILYLAAMALVLAASAAADGGDFARAMIGHERLEVADLQRAEVELAMTLGAALQTLALGALWYAPLLVGWNRVPVARAAFYSAVAVAINWRAFLAYGAGITLLFAGVLMAALGAAMLFSGAGPAQANMALFSSILALLPVWFGSSYLSYVEVFGEVPAQP
jgi:hypothetical protein